MTAKDSNKVIVDDESYRNPHLAAASIYSTFCAGEQIGADEVGFTADADSEILNILRARGLRIEAGATKGSWRVVGRENT